MADFKLTESLNLESTTKIVMLIMDGLGGLPMTEQGQTELEAARTPNLDDLASQGSIGQIIPIRPGITPGSGPAHLSLFGYDPIEHQVGRGVLEAIGVNMQVSESAVAARGNFCTVDSSGNIVDRRAGRIPSDQALPIVDRLREVTVPGVDIRVQHVREYRFAVVMDGPALSGNIADTDPQKTGVPPLPANALDDDSGKTAELFNAWIQQSREAIVDEPQANAITLRGFSSDPNLPKFKDVYGLRAVCVAVYPMYRGVSRLVGMEVQEFSGEAPEDEFAAVARVWNDYDFFFVHIKKTDSKGEDGDFDGKVAVIEGVDSALPNLMNLKPDVLAVTGDHSTPAKFRTHSWHPVPFMLWAPDTVRPDPHESFGERLCAVGGLGTFHGTDIMPLLLAHGKRLAKYGA